MINVPRIATFKNPLKEDFTFYWDKEPYTITAGQTIQLPDFLAKHGCKHLTDYIILRPELWNELGIKRTDRGDILDKDGDVKNPPRLDDMKGREEIAKMIILSEKVNEVIKKTQKQELDETIKELNKPNESSPETSVEEEFADLKK